MVQIHIPPDGNSPWNRWLIRLVLAGLVGCEIAAMIWIVYKIVSPKY
jgi:hypothetical protein